MLESVSGLVVVVGHGLAVDHYLECNDRPSTLCLTQGYSTFELPLRNKANLIKIGGWRDTARVIVLMSNILNSSIIHDNQSLTTW